MKNLRKIFQKQKEKHSKGLSFINKFKIEILLSFSGFRKVLGKMMDSVWFLSTRGLLQDPLTTYGTDKCRIVMFCMLLTIQMISWINVSLLVKAKNYISRFAYAFSKNNVEC